MGQRKHIILAQAKMRALLQADAEGAGERWFRNEAETKKPLNRNSGASLRILVGRAGLEPATNGLKVRCSTN